MSRCCLMLIRISRLGAMGRIWDCRRCKRASFGLLIFYFSENAQRFSESRMSAFLFKCLHNDFRRETRFSSEKQCVQNKKSGSLSGASHAAVWSILSTRVHALTQPPNQPTTFVDSTKVSKTHRSCKYFIRFIAKQRYMRFPRLSQKEQSSPAVRLRRFINNKKPAAHHCATGPYLL